MKSQRLPTYHCKFNPLELILGDLKGYISSENSTFKLNDVKILIERGFSQVTQEKLANAWNHVKMKLNQSIGNKM